MGLKDELSKMDLSVSEPRIGERPRRLHASGALPAPTALMQGMAGLDELKERAARAGELELQLTDARKTLSQWEGAKAARPLDPALISRSLWANRHSRHFDSSAFTELKSEIANAGGNVVPIKVRLLPAASGDKQRYEVVYGHRRLEACLQLGLPVLSFIDALGDVELFVEMERENRGREDLSAWEQGRTYRRALDSGLFPSNRRLAEAIGVDLGNLGKALALASLEDALVDAFPSPLDLQFRWAKPLKDAWDRDPVALKKLAAEVAKMSPHPSSKTVFQLLTGAAAKGGVVPYNPPAAVDIEVAGKRVAKVSMNARGAALVSIEPGSIPPSRLGELASLIERYLASPKSRAR